MGVIDLDPTFRVGTQPDFSMSRTDAVHTGIHFMAASIGFIQHCSTTLERAIEYGRLATGTESKACVDRPCPATSCVTSATCGITHLLADVCGSMVIIPPIVWAKSTPRTIFEDLNAACRVSRHPNGAVGDSLMSVVCDKAVVKMP